MRVTLEESSSWNGKKREDRMMGKAGEAYGKEHVAGERKAEDVAEKKDERNRSGAVHELCIGDVVLANNLILGPMAGVCDAPFRLLCHEQGAGLVCMEMVSAKALFFKNKKTQTLMYAYPQEHPVSLQLFGSDPVCMGEMAREIEDRDFEILDINMGCPVPKVVGNGDGSALMKDPVLAGKVIESCVKAIRKPVTVKIRKGFDDAHVNAVEIAHIAEECGAAAVTVHGRTREQYYSGTADWDIIRRVKEAVRIPVIGNGDIRVAEDVRRMYDETGCDGFMIARAAQGDPWIFSRILREYSGEEKAARPQAAEIAETILRHARMQIAYKGEYVAMREMRKHAAWYMTGLPGAARLRGQLNEVESYGDLEKAMDIFLGKTMGKITATGN